MRTILIVTLALVFGGSAAVGVAKLGQGAPAAAVETAPVVVAVADVPRFTTVTPDLLKIRDYPKDMVPSGSLSRIEDAVDRVTEITILKDEPVLEGKLADKGAGRGMAAVIPRGMRAVTIKTPNVASGVAGFILPGNKVDVLFTRQTHRENDPSGGGSTTTLIQNVEILAVDQQIEAPADNKVSLKELKSVTLLVTPDQAAQTDLAQNLGTLTLSLRNPQDTEPAGASVATLRNIQFRQGKPWDERLKILVDAGARAVADIQAAAAKDAKEKAAQAEKERAARAAQAAQEKERERRAAAELPPPKVRTLRGGIPSQVELNN